MNNADRSRECQAILEELWDALGVARAFPDSGELRAARDALLALFREAGEDEERTEELFRKYRFRPQYPLLLPSTAFLHPKTREVIRRLLEHRTRTGHACGLLRPK